MIRPRLAPKTTKGRDPLLTQLRRMRGVSGRRAKKVIIGLSGFAGGKLEGSISGSVDWVKKTGEQYAHDGNCRLSARVRSRHSRGRGQSGGAAACGSSAGRLSFGPGGSSACS